MNKKFVYGAIAITFIVAVLALLAGVSHSGVQAGSTPTVTTNLPSLGVTQLAVGSGCDQQYTTCTGLGVDSSGNITSTGSVTTNSTATIGGVLATTTPASMTLKASDLAYSTISDLLTVGAATITLPASSTLSSFLPNSGDRTTLAITNATTAAFNITMAGGSGSLFQNASTSAIILPLKTALMFITRKANTDITFTFIPAI